jgi:hypothetical protein
VRIVSPFRPFPPESDAHRALGPFDWIRALRMLRHSAAANSACETLAITDVDTDLPVPAFQYATTERRLMLWILEVCLRYLESDDFDQDTVMVCPDILVMGDLRRYFVAELGVVVRLDPKYVEAERPLLNSVQWWRARAKDRLVDLYRRALLLARMLDEETLTWGADTVPLVQLLSPLGDMVCERAGLTVRMFNQRQVMAAFNSTLHRQMESGVLKPTEIPLLDFRYGRKAWMAQFFSVAFGQQVPA